MFIGVGLVFQKGEDTYCVVTLSEHAKREKESLTKRGCEILKEVEIPDEKGAMAEFLKKHDPCHG